jgi:ABC-type uncharacterized transport system permease subunit
VVIELHQLAAACYLAAGLGTFLGLALPEPRWVRGGTVALAAGVVFHGLAFARLHTLDPPPSLTHLPSALSLMAWLAAAFALGLSRRERLASLAGLVAPFAFLAVFYAGFALDGQPVAPTEPAGSWPHLHVILASAGLALLGIAGLAGLLFLAEDRRLKAKRLGGFARRLPSLEALDRVNLTTLALGFPLLTLGVVAGVIWTEGTTGRLWAGGAHATWTGIAWAIYLALTVARFAVGWRGREAAACAAAGFAFLLFAVVGVRAIA